MADLFRRTHHAESQVPGRQIAGGPEFFFARCLLAGDTWVAISGDNADDFTVTAEPDASVKQGDTATFTVQFTPTDAGERSATLTIDNNDSDGSSYLIYLSGTGVSDSNPYDNLRSGCGHGRFDRGCGH